MASIVKKPNGYEVGCRCGWRQNASTPELATTLRDGHLCEIDKLTAVVVIAREMAQADCACGECFACRFREALDSVVVKDDGDPAREALLTEIRRVTSERNAAVHNESETAMLLAEAREHIERLTAHDGRLYDAERETLKAEIARLAGENERLEVEAMKWHGEALKQERISEMYAKASIDAQEISRIDRDERDEAVSEKEKLQTIVDGLTKSTVTLGEQRDALGRALKDLLTAFLYEASQGDGVAEEFVPRVEAAKAALATLPQTGIVVKPRPVPICGACRGPLPLDDNDTPYCQTHGPVKPRGATK